MRLETLINESDKRLFHKMGNQAHCLHSVLPPLPCSASLQIRPKGHPYELPRYKYDLSRKSFVLRCLYNFVWFYVFWLYDFNCAFHIRLICVQLKRYILLLVGRLLKLWFLVFDLYDHFAALVLQFRFCFHRCYWRLNSACELIAAQRSSRG